MTIQRFQQKLCALSIALACTCQSSDAWLLTVARPNGPQRTKWLSMDRTTFHSARRDGGSSVVVVCRMSPSRSGSVFDADFERVDNNKPKAKRKRSKAPTTGVKDDDDDSSRTLFDVSLDMDPDWKEARIPFVDGRDEKYIDGKLAFTVDLDGVTYGIAVPFDYGAAIVFEKPDGTVQYLSPDQEENVELLEIMARQLQEHVDEDLKLQRTPRILTISGPLSKYTDKWQNTLVPKPVEVDALLDDSDEDLESFHAFMRQELGDEEYSKTIQEAATMTEFDDEIMELFNIPGIGQRKDDVEGIEKIFKSIMSGEDDAKNMPFPGSVDNLDHDGVALKLISYRFPNGKAYSLVYLLKPFTLVGKYSSNDETGIRFELLSPDEEKIIIPKIEELCQEDFQRAGLTLSTP